MGLKKGAYYGLTGVKEVKKYLYFLPLIIIGTVNLWNGAELIQTLMQICYAIYINKTIEE